MKKSTILKIVIYPLAGLVGYFGTKYFFPTKEDQLLREQEKARKKIEDHIIKDPKVLPDPVDIVPSGGFTPPDDPWITRFLANERKYVIGGVATVCAVAITTRFHAAIAEILKEALPAINALPIPLAKKLLLGLDKMSFKQIYDTLKTGLTSNELTISQKLSLVKKSLIHLIISARTANTSKVLVVSGILTLLSLTLANGALFAGALAIVQDIFSKAGFQRATVEYIVDIYKEYNAPIPLELAELIQKVGSTA